ncbi:hypothetical protein D3C81_1896100 [compost metagenome]
MTVHTHSENMFDSHANRALWVTPLPMLSCHGLGSAAWAHANAGASSAAPLITVFPNVLPHLMRCFIA